MMINYIILSIVLLCFFLASIEDIKKREVYDYLNYLLALFVIVAAFFDFLLTSSFEPIKYCGFGLLVGFALGSILFYSGIWGGGDAKFLIGFSGASFYLMNFVEPTIYFESLYEVISYFVSAYLLFFLEFIIDGLIVLNVIFLLFLVIQFIVRKDKAERGNLLMLFLIMFFLSLGLFFDFDGSSLVFLGFLSFMIIFFANEDIFNSVYFNVKKYLSEINEGDKVDESIKVGDRLIKRDNIKYGIAKEDVNYIHNNMKKDKKVLVRKVLPYSFLIAVNYIVYLFKIISLDKINLEILGFLFKFLFYSFLIGGVIAIFILVYCLIKNFKKIDFSLKFIEKVLLFGLFIISLGMVLVNRSFLLFLLFIPFYLFVKVAKDLESLIFVKKKSINKITLGDWIVEDVYAGDEMLYSVNDFKLGVNEKQLDKIRKFSKKYDNLKSLYVKDGLAFLPPLFVGFLLMLII